MRVQRDHAKLVDMTVDEDEYADISPAERVSFIWELTAEVWSLGGDDSAQSRLQRNITNLVREQG
jgi:hypothetical protein